jgi:hypothetical protein
VNATGGGIIYTNGIAPTASLTGTASGTADIIIEWAEMERLTDGDPNVNFQVVLHESDNSIDYNYANLFWKNKHDRSDISPQR